MLLITMVSVAQAQNKDLTYRLPAVDVLAEKSKGEALSTGPLKYALSTAVKDISHKKGNASPVGQWLQLPDKSWEYTLRIAADGATSLNVGMKDFFLPHSAELWVHTDDESIMRGPYNDSYNKSHGYFWVGDVPADHINLKITVSDKEKRHLTFAVDNVTRGFFNYWEEPSYLAKSGSCNVDVACPDGDDWQAQINAVGRYTFTTVDGSFLCTGQLINNTALDGKPLFSTADHCGYSSNTGQRPLSQRQNTAASIGMTWNYQSQTCRAPGSTQSGTQISTTGFNDRQSGATYLASNPASDFALVELNETPDASYGVEYTGWDRSDVAPNSAVSIHHPSGHAKRISYENDPLSITSYLSTTRGAGTHLRVADWDTGTTEGGSSGGGLWNSDQLMVGQLHGGFAACGNNRDDWYGRLFVSWDTGDDAQSRMKEWLDPLNTGQMTLQGSGGCDAPTVAIVNNSSNQVGDLLTFSSQVSGGSGGYTYEWDVNADTSTDGTSSSIQARYAQAYTGNISLTVKDSAGCQAVASQAVVVESAHVELQQIVNIRENLNQVCGNNDLVVDPGERWGTTVMARNTGSQTATDTYLAFGKSRATADAANSDSYGNTTSSCDRLFIDITDTGTAINWTTAGTQYDADDEGFASVQLSQAFDHYGESINQLVASTNGYFSTNSSSLGDDWSNDCPLPTAPERDSAGARIAPMHDDMKGSTFYHQSFAVCPRPAETGNDLACEVFLWKGADLWATTNDTESIDVQAILYPATSQWVYQYSGAGFDGSSSTTGMQNTTASDGLSFACDSAGSINTTAAVCTYNKDFQPQSNGADFLALETPVISLGNLAVNASQTRELEFTIATDAACGAEFSINHEASVFDEGFNAGQNNILTARIGNNNGQCNVVNSCNIDSSNAIQPTNGVWYNPDRSGNGHDMHFINKVRLMYVTYTGLPDRSPIWYITGLEETANEQYFNELYKVSYPGGFGVGSQVAEKMGWSNTTVLDQSHAIVVRNISGELSAEKIQVQPLDDGPTTNEHTGFYYNSSESGWGESITTRGAARGIVTYLYDASGQPYWTNAWGPNDNSTLRVAYTESFCLHCPRVMPISTEVGTATFTLTDQRTGLINEYNVNVPAALRPGATWSRTNLPISNLIPPIED